MDLQLRDKVMMVAAIPMGRLGRRINEFGKAGAFLLSEAATAPRWWRTVLCRGRFGEIGDWRLEIVC